MSICINDLRLSRQGKHVLTLANVQLAKSTQGLITGHSGSGKTTLLFALGGLIVPDHGSIHVNGQRLQDYKDGERDRWRGQNVGYVFQEMHIISHLSVLNNILLAGALAQKKIDKQWLVTIMSVLGLENLQKRYGHQLSTGEKQRVAIARSIVHRPQLLLADEPTSGLDDRNTEAVITLLQMAARLTGATLLIATHDNRLGQHMPVCLTLDGRGESA